MSYCNATPEGGGDSSGGIDHGAYLEQEERRAWSQQFSAGGGFQNPGMHLSGIPAAPLAAVAGTNSGHVWDQHVRHDAMHHQVAIDRYSPAHRAAALHQRHQGLHGGGHQHPYGCQVHIPADQLRILAHRAPGHVGTTPTGYDEDWNESPFWGIDETPAATAGENARYSTVNPRGLGSNNKSGAGEHKAGNKRTHSRQHNQHGASTAGAQRDVSKSSAPPSAPDNGSCRSSPPTSLMDDSDVASPPGTPSMFVNPDTSNNPQWLQQQQQLVTHIQQQNGGTSLSPNSAGDDVVKGASASNSVSGASTASMDAYLMQFYRGMAARANEHEIPEFFRQQTESRQGMNIMDKNASLERENEMLRGMLARDKQETMALLNLLMKRKDESKDSDDIEGSAKRPRYWTDEEHMRFLGAMKIFGQQDFNAISQAVGTRTPAQVRSHSQRYFKKLDAHKGDGLPSMSRKKR